MSWSPSTAPKHSTTSPSNMTPPIETHSSHAPSVKMTTGGSFEHGPTTFGGALASAGPSGAKVSSSSSETSLATWIFAHSERSRAAGAAILPNVWPSAKVSLPLSDSACLKPKRPDVRIASINSVNASTLPGLLLRVRLPSHKPVKSSKRQVRRISDRRASASSQSWPPSTPTDSAVLPARTGQRLRYCMARSA